MYACVSVLKRSETKQTYRNSAELAENNYRSAAKNRRVTRSVWASPKDIVKFSKCAQCDWHYMNVPYVG